ncbi:MAG: glycosyltransferase family 29 protein [Geminicoccaceae bacterium]
MPAIGLRTFHEMFADARSIALVGNADTILDYASGERIDGCDIVVRFNRAHVDGIEDKVGRRTDILVANRNYNLKKAPAPAATLQPRCVVCFLEPQAEIDYRAFADWTGDLPTLTVFAPDLLAAAQVTRTRPVTMGTNALYSFVNLFRLERLFLTGFTFYGAAGSGQGVYWQDERKSRGVFHDLEPEAQIFASIVGRFGGEVEATPEVRELLRRYGNVNGTGSAVVQARVESLYASLGWQLIRWGTRLRRRAESRHRGQFSDGAKGKSAGTKAATP